MPDRKLNFNRIAAVLLFILLSLPFCILFVSADTAEDIPLSGFSCEAIPEYNGEPAVILHDNIPEFTLWQLNTTAFVRFSPLDELGRTKTGYACLGKETLPTSSRGMIGNIRPSGWHTVRYDDLIEDRYLYNRSHVIGFLLSGDTATPENLFTGTRYLNATSMVQYETKVAQYIEKTGNHVLYRVSLCYRGDDLVPFGVQMEGYSIEDHGQGICFNVFLYNVQPGIVIDYTTGDSMRASDAHANSSPQLRETIESVPGSDRKSVTESSTADIDEAAVGADVSYVLNKNSGKFHLPACPSVQEMKPQNREYFYGSREEALSLGYVPCGSCKP